MQGHSSATRERVTAVVRVGIVMVIMALVADRRRKERQPIQP